MSSKYTFSENDHLYFVSFAVVNWVDAFTRREYKDIIVNSLKYCQQKKGLELYAWVVMTSHIHLIIGSATNTLSDIMRDMKKHTSSKIKDAIDSNFKESRKEWMMDLFRNAGKANSNNDNFQFWQQDNHPIQLITPKFTHQKLDYIHNNPVVEGIVDKPEDYLYSSARDYYGTGKGLLDIILIDPLIVTY
ncbi:MAG TPA: transposase [Panacibacter sp.]|nr:transposase [Panacibacter sp.]HNP44482.1 transposase [Panacibacter sp.]